MQDAPDTPEEKRDRHLLRQISAARSANDTPTESARIGELLACYMPAIRARLAEQLRRRGLATPTTDTDDITSSVAERLLRILLHKTDFGQTPFAAVVSLNVAWAMADYWRDRQRRAKYESYATPDDIDDLAYYVGPTPFQQASAVSGILRAAGLTNLERSVALERAVFDLTPNDVAQRHQARRSAIDMTYSRALKKLRDSLM